MSVSSTSQAPFDGRHFGNISGRSQHGASEALRWMFSRKRGPWPERVANTTVPRPVARVDDGSIRATLVGHATVLLQVAGLNILTDPVWSERIGPYSWLGVKRIRSAAIAFDDLPKIDVVLLSHNHYDHLDRPTLAKLARRDRPLVLTGLKVGKSVPSDHVVEMQWWDSHALGDRVTATYVPAEHFSGRGAFDRNASLWGGFVLETPMGPIYFAGDTGDGEHFATIKAHFGPMKLSLIPIGAYAPRWCMAPVHIDPAEALAASITLASEVSLAMHFGTFCLADDSYDEPPIALQHALAAVQGKPRGIDFRVPDFGEPTVIKPSV
jgi:L-ascorbate metabolism protein UlaG (beta-lactamase superfamily)